MTYISTMGQALDQIERLKNMQSQLSTLQYQLSSGKKADSFSGLETDTLPLLRARTKLQAFETYEINITQADRRIGLMVTAIKEFKTQAQNVEEAVIGQIQQGEVDMGVVTDLSNNIDDFLIDLVNTKDGERYLFGGADGGNKPLENTGLLDTFTQSQVDDWINGVIDTDTLIANIKDRTVLNDTTAGYNAALASSEAGNVFVRVDETTELDYTVKANNDGFRDIVVAVSMLRSIGAQIDQVKLGDSDPATTVIPPGTDDQDRTDNFFELYNELARMINQGVTDLEGESEQIQQVQAQVQALEEDYLVAKDNYQTIVSNIEDADMTEVALKINTFMIQLNASFQTTASLRDLTLVNFI